VTVRTLHLSQPGIWKYARRAAPPSQRAQTQPERTVPERHRILVLLPTYNEAGNLELMLAAIHEHLAAADILVIDDNSPDGTGALAERAAAKAPHVKVAHRHGKQGLGVAYRFGYRWALDHGYDRVLQMDCDFSHDPKDLPRIVELLRIYPAVVGSRRVCGGGADGWAWYRNLISMAGNLYARSVLSSPVRDLTTGFKGFRAEALKKLGIEKLRTDGFGFQIEVTTTLLTLGVRVHEMPIRFVDRAIGTSKMSTRIFLEAMWKVWDIRSGANKLRASRLPRGVRQALSSSFSR
jgi:dolichol-phosphate mannosyltransferase